jgi:hypothetical protein
MLSNSRQDTRKHEKQPCRIRTRTANEPERLSGTRRLLAFEAFCFGQQRDDIVIAKLAEITVVDANCVERIWLKKADQVISFRCKRCERIGWADVN